VGGGKPRGTITVGMRQSVAEHCVMPRIAHFLSRFPDVELVTRSVTTEQIERQSLDLAVMVGWPPEGSLVSRHLAQTRHIVCASGEYWAKQANLSIRRNCAIITASFSETMRACSWIAGASPGKVSNAASMSKRACSATTEASSMLQPWRARV